MKLLKAEWEVNKQEGGEEFKCYMIWQMLMAMLHSNGQDMMEKDEDTEKGCQKPAVRSVTLNLANKFSQCTFRVAEHYDLFSDLIILRQA